MIKKSLLFGFLFLMFSTSAFATIRNIQDNFKLIYNVIDTSGDHVGSETVTLAIQKASNGYWYDFNDDTFKNSGWTNKTTNLIEDSTNGLYHYTFNPPVSETATEEYVFLVDNASATYGDHQSESVCYQNIGTSTLITSDIWTAGARTLTSGGYSGLTATDIDNIWDEVQTGHVTANSFGKYLDAQVSTGGSTAAEIADAVWNETSSEHLTAGTTGKKLSEMPTPYDIGP